MASLRVVFVTEMILADWPSAVVTFMPARRLSVVIQHNMVSGQRVQKGQSFFVAITIKITIIEFASITSMRFKVLFFLEAR